MTRRSSRPLDRTLPKLRELAPRKLRAVLKSKPYTKRKRERASSPNEAFAPFSPYCPWSEGLLWCHCPNQLQSKERISKEMKCLTFLLHLRSSFERLSTLAGQLADHFHFLWYSLQRMQQTNLKGKSMSKAISIWSYSFRYPILRLKSHSNTKSYENWRNSSFPVQLVDAQ